jgi:hypothetical protein
MCYFTNQQCLMQQQQHFQKNFQQQGIPNQWGSSQSFVYHTQTFQVI